RRARDRASFLEVAMTNAQESQVVLIGPGGKALIRKTPGVCGGDACIGNTRIMVWLLVSLKQQGMTDPELLQGYPTLTERDLAAAWEYHGRHPDEIAEAIKANEEDEY